MEGAEKAIASTGEIPQEVKQRMFEVMPDLGWRWPIFEAMVGRRQSRDREFVSSLGAETGSAYRGLSTVREGAEILKSLVHPEGASITEVAIGRHAIPDREAIDRIVRYAANCDRLLDRAIDRLEGLQRYRKEKEKAAPPPVSAPQSARMTQ